MPSGPRQIEVSRRGVSMSLRIPRGRSLERASEAATDGMSCGTGVAGLSGVAAIAGLHKPRHTEQRRMRMDVFMAGHLTVGPPLRRGASKVDFCGRMIYRVVMGIWRSNLGWAYRGAVTAILSLAGLAVSQEAGRPSDRPLVASPYSGSPSCRSCHEGFYRLWSTSHHGLAMQPYTKDLASRELTAQAEPIRIGNSHYRAIVEAHDPNSGFVLESAPTGGKGLSYRTRDGRKERHLLPDAPGQGAAPGPACGL